MAEARVEFPSLTYAQRVRAVADAAVALIRVEESERSILYRYLPLFVERAVWRILDSGHQSEAYSKQFLVDVEKEVLARLGYEE